MVAYSFKKRFGPPILAGTKAQTIRADRKRHARPGEELQLFTGMRTKHCRLGRAPCTAVLPIRLCFTKRGATELFQLGGSYLTLYAMEIFAKADGFTSIADMADFWWVEHPPAGGNVLSFEGVVICWKPIASADALDIAARAA